MTPAAALRPSPPARASRLRWLPILIFSALLHLLLIAEVGDMLPMPTKEKPMSPEQVVAASLLVPPPPPPPPAKPAPKPKPKPSVRPKPAAPPAAPVVDEPLPETDVTEQPIMEDDPAMLTETDGTDVAQTADAAEAASPSNLQPDPQPELPSYSVSLPPSARIKYAIEKKPHDGEPMHGSGTIDWQTDGTRYAIDGEFGVLFITALRFRSSGTIEQSGIAPELYAEKRLRRSETNTHFHRERNTISFSASTNSYPRLGTEQDRASIVWQLAGIGRGDAEHFQAGTTIRIVVAGTRDAEPWEINVVGLEQIDVDGEATEAWHLLRVPRPGSYDQKLEFWLAPALGWYPVRLRYTEPNGDVLDMNMTRLNVSNPSGSQ